MIPEASMEPTSEGLAPRGEGWYVLNLSDAAWGRNERFGAYCAFEGDVRFPHFGINVHVLQPGQPNCLYHAESAQEAFLVLSGECLLIVEGQERRLQAWDFFHCPPGTRHVFVGAGSGPCAILMAGARAPHDASVLYPVEPAALKHGAGVEAETPEPRTAYAAAPPWSPSRAPWPEGPGV